MKDLEKFWSLEQIGISSNQEDFLTKEEFLAQEMQNTTTFYNKEEKTWYTSLLFKDRPPKLGNNKSKALAILQKVEKSAIQQGRVEDLNRAYQELVEQGFAEVVTEEEEPEEVHYLPGHPVYKDERESTKVRIVFNASSTTSTGKSLNQCLYQGPNPLPEINHVLLRWRCNIIAFVLDISKMFLRIKLHKDQDYLRFLWRNCDPKQKPTILRLLSVSFGLVSSPFQAVDVVKKHSDLFEEELSLAAEEVPEQLYMDDVPSGDSITELAKKKLEEIYNLFLLANMQPHKIASNCKEILENIPEEFRSTKDTIKVLGALWNTISDVLTFDIQKKSNVGNDTKRSFLEYSASIFDPLGMLAPFSMRIKLLFQQVWLAELEEKSKAKKGWDSILPPNIQEEWNSIKEEIPLLNDIKIPRSFFTKGQGKPLYIKLFAFGDASCKAYATVIYIAGYHEDGTISTNFAFSKTRVAPLKMVQNMDKNQSIVRLELLAALITARAVVYVQTAIEKKMKILEIHCFTDSLINLCRIRKGPETYKMWVANRLTEILEKTTQDQWNHCPGPLNPADLPSRGLSASELKESTLWWNGPSFIKEDKSAWPNQAESQLYNKDPEMKAKVSEVANSDLVAAVSASLNTFNISVKINWDFVQTVVSRYEHWFDITRLMAYILRMASKSHRIFSRKEYSQEEHKKTEDFLWSLTQRHHFPEEFQQLLSKSKIAEKSSLSCYNPEMDFDNFVIKSNTRLKFSNLPEDTKKSIILPKNCPIVAKYIMDIHKSNEHAGTGYIHSILKERFILPQGRNQIRKTIRSCVARRCVKPRLLAQQQAPLPEKRVDNAAPFESVAVDLFGPMMVHHKCSHHDCPHPKEEKVHCALFTCFHSRAVHLELVENTGTEEFINALRAFVARRGTPTTIYSDNAKGFKASSKEVRRLYESINWTKVKEEGIKRNIEWFFSTEKAPHQNGLCERMVRTVKNPLRIVIGAARLTKNQLRLILQEVEAVVNNRPLGTTSNNPEDLTPITPMELINGRRLEQLPDPNKQINQTSFAHLWRKRQAILNQFWKRWHNDYLINQNIRRTWKNPTNEDLLGKIVLIKDDSLSRNEWKIARIIETITSKDGLIRNVVVKTHSSTLRRPVQKLALLENV